MRLFQVIKVIGKLFAYAIARRSHYMLTFRREDYGVGYIDFSGFGDFTYKVWVYTVTLFVLGENPMYIHTQKRTALKE